MTDPVAVRRLEGVPDAWWDDLCGRARSPWNARAFGILQAEAGVEPVFLVAEAGGVPVGGASVYLAGSRRVRVFNRVFARIAFVPDEPAVADGSEGTLPALLDAVEREIGESRAVAATFRVEMPRLLSPEDLRARGYEVAARGVGVLDLPEAEAEVEGLLHRTARKQARRAERDGLLCEVAPTVDRLLPLLDLSFRRAGLPPRNHRLVRRLHELLAGEVLVVRNRDRDVAALLWGRVGPMGLNLFHGRDDGDIEGASNFLHREMFVHAVRAGVRVLHTGDAALQGEGGARVQGITHFKRTLGFEIREAFQGNRVLRPVAAGLRRRTLELWNSVRGGTDRP